MPCEYELYSEDADDGNRTRNPFKPSALAIELNSSKSIAGKELSLFSWCVPSLYVYHFSTVKSITVEK